MDKDTPLSPAEAAAYLSMTEGTLAVYRHEKKGPKYFKPNGKKIFYFVSDLDDWIRGEGQ
jgi:hypothetical protein